MFFNHLPLFIMMGPCWQGIDPELAIVLDQVALQMSAAAEAIALAFPQVRVLDLYTLGAVSFHQGGRERDYGSYSYRRSMCFCFIWLVVLLSWGLLSHVRVILGLPAYIVTSD